MMKPLSERMKNIENNINDANVTVMIIGLGSVGSYLLDYLTESDPPLKIVVVGRNKEKMESDVNIVRISSLIRRKNKSKIEIADSVNLENADEICSCIAKYKPDFIVNSSRVYSGLKYGTISWNALRAYGIWSPLAVKYIKNISKALDTANTDSILINTSYSDAVIPWLKSANHYYPDFGSGNINHLVPRIKYAVSDIIGVNDYWNVDVMFATAHFHDVVISKEGHDEGVKQLLQCKYNGKVLDIPNKDIFERCKISMPTDAKRNMMNASSNYDIISSIINIAQNGGETRIFSPGAFGEIGGYPVAVKKENGGVNAEIDTSVFSMEDMRQANRKSIALDGIEDVKDGSLIYTDILLDKVKTAFNVELPKIVKLDDADEVAKLLINEIIIPQTRNE